jgi:peptidoglycan/LPS O-acetylase OafA/YrhL
VVVATSAASVQPPGGAGRFIALDSLRGLAALCIVYYHMGAFGWLAGLQPFRYGWMLVDFFFILSGFVITASYGSRLAQGYPRWRFLLIRLGRVYPLHIATVALWIALEFLVFRPVLDEAHPLSDLARAVFMLDAFAKGAGGNFFAPVSWAVAVELVLYACAAALFGRGRWALALAVLATAASAWALWTGFNVVGFGRLLQRGMLGFPIGVACFWLHQRLRTVEPGPVALSLAETALLVALVWLLGHHGKTASWIPGVDVLFAVTVLVFARDGGVVSRALQVRPLVALGQLSFAIYMVHLFFVILPSRFLPSLIAAMGHADWINPAPNAPGLLVISPPAWIATLISLGLTALVLLVAWLAWRFIEEPARRWTRRFAPPSGGPPVPAI